MESSTSLQECEIKVVIYQFVFGSDKITQILWVSGEKMVLFFE
jgi:hypothetical protein